LRMKQYCSLSWSDKGVTLSIPLRMKRGRLFVPLSWVAVVTFNSFEDETRDEQEDWRWG